jgi:hypothetical protein
VARAQRDDSEEPARPRQRKPATQGTLWNHLSGRIDAPTSALLVFPLFALYQLGILASAGQNGVDFVTRALVELVERDLVNYLFVLAGSCVAYAALLVILRRYGTFNPRAFLPVLAESTFYALTMGTLILFVMHQLGGIAPSLSVGGKQHSVLDVLVISAGAGLHEELVFRVVGVTGLAWLLGGVTGDRRALILAVVISSLVFSLAHHIGPAGEAFSAAAFVYRTLAGLFFAVVYYVRGFAVAAWTHALYDVYVLLGSAG